MGRVAKQSSKGRLVRSPALPNSIEAIGKGKIPVSIRTDKGEGRRVVLICVKVSPQPAPIHSAKNQGKHRKSFVHIYLPYSTLPYAKEAKFGLS